MDELFILDKKVVRKTIETKSTELNNFCAENEVPLVIITEINEGVMTSLNGYNDTLIDLLIQTIQLVEEKQ